VVIDDISWYQQTLGLAARVLHYGICRQRVADHAEVLVDEADWVRLYAKGGWPAGDVCLHRGGHDAARHACSYRDGSDDSSELTMRP
jgi:hypothetical protein